MKITRLLFLLTLFAFTGAIHAQTYTTTTVFSGLQMSVAFDIASDGRFFCTQKGDGGTPASPGTATIVVYNSAGVLIGTFYDLSDSVNSDFERGLLGITLDPDFDNNHYVYVYYNHRLAGDERIRIVRFTEVSNVGTSPTIIFDLDVSNSIAGNHVGGNLHFRPSDPTHIYFTIGDLAYQQGNPALNYADDLDKPYGKVLRISSSPLAPPPPWGELEMTPREAFLGPQEVVAVEAAAGRIAAESLAAYPPGIPNVLPGERLTRETLDYIRESVEQGGYVRGSSDRELRTLRVAR